MELSFAACKAVTLLTSQGLEVLMRLAYQLTGAIGSTPFVWLGESGCTAVAERPSRSGTLDLTFTLGYSWTCQLVEIHLASSGASFEKEVVVDDSVEMSQGCTYSQMASCTLLVSLDQGSERTKCCILSPVCHVSRDQLRLSDRNMISPLAVALSSTSKHTASSL